MPTATRRQVNAPSRNQRVNVPTVDPPQQQEESLEDAAADDDVEYEGQEVEDASEDEMQDHAEPDPFPPPGLKEISSLASWTVSTAKPGNGVAALRSPDLAHFWQSDGPQPHLLSIHLFKLVPIVHMRVYLDFLHDESYTPTKIQFLAGMGVHDIQQFSEMCCEQPTGWIDVDFSKVGPIEADNDDDEDQSAEIDWSKRPVLRAFLVQVRILENHQNGKDTHLRAVQLFARDDAYQVRKSAERASLAPRAMSKQAIHHAAPNNIQMASWMLEPDLR